MKKILFIIVMIALVSLSVYSESIKVTAPKAGETLKVGEPYFIKWTAPGTTGPNVKINIFRNSITQANFVEQINSKNTGSVKWVISKKFSPGNYQLRIKSATNNKIIGDSGVFLIAAAPKTPPPPPPGPKSSNLPTILNPNQLKPGLVKSNTIVLSELKGPQIVYFTPDKSTINKGEAVLLKFHYKNATKAQLFNRWNGKEILFTPKYPEFKSFIEVKPDTTTRYELIVTGGFKMAKKEFYVTVNAGSKPPLPSPSKLPVVSFFKAVPDLVDYGKGTVLKLKATNAKSIIVKDPKGKVVFNWAGAPGDHVVKDIHVNLYSEKNTYELVASNNNGNHFGTAWARWRSVVRDFSVKGVNKQKIIFHYDYSLAETAKIKHFKSSQNKWVTILELKCFSLSCNGDKEVTHAPGKYKLVLIGREGVFESNIVKVN